MNTCSEIPLNKMQNYIHKNPSCMFRLYYSWANIPWSLVPRSKGLVKRHVRQLSFDSFLFLMPPSNIIPFILHSTHGCTHFSRSCTLLSLYLSFSYLLLLSFITTWIWLHHLVSSCLSKKQLFHCTP